MSTPRCDACHYAQLVGTGLQCKRYPPTIIMAPTENGIRPVNILPGMQASEWCGEFKPGIKLATELPKTNGLIIGN